MSRIVSIAPWMTKSIEVTAKGRHHTLKKDGKQIRKQNTNPYVCCRERARRAAAIMNYVDLDDTPDARPTVLASVASPVKMFQGVVMADPDDKGFEGPEWIHRPFGKPENQKPTIRYQSIRGTGQWHYKKVLEERARNDKSAYRAPYVKNVTIARRSELSNALMKVRNQKIKEQPKPLTRKQKIAARTQRARDGKAAIRAALQK